jgi:hypothetical protein
VGFVIFRRKHKQNQGSNFNAVPTVSGSTASLPTNITVSVNRPENDTSVMSNISHDFSSDEMLSTHVKQCETAGKSKASSINRRKIKKRKQAQHNFTLMFATIILIYVVSYFPTILLVMLPGSDSAHFWFSKNAVELNILIFLRRTFLLSNIVNPFIYTYFDLSFRRELINMLSCCRKCG